MNDSTPGRVVTENVVARESTSAVRSADCEAGDRRFVQEARSASPDSQSGDVHRVRGQHPHDGALDSGARRRRGSAGGFIFGISAWLWFTVLFANFAEAMAEGRGKAQADSLRASRREVMAKMLDEPRHGAKHGQSSGRASCAKDDVVLVEAGDQIPADGEVIEGVASVDESAITGESAPVIRESGGDRSSVTGGTRVLSDWLVVRVTANPGETFLDRMIALVEGAKRQKTPNEIALNILLAAMTIIFLVGVRHAAAVLALQRRTPPGQGDTDHGHGARGAAGLLDSDDDRRPAFGDRHRRHGPHDSGERHCHVRAAPSRPPATWTCCCSTRPARSRSATGRPWSSFRPRASSKRPSGRRGTTRVAGRRNARRAQHRRAGQGKIRSARPRRARSARHVHSVFRADADERRRSRRPADPQRRRRCD